MVKIFQDDDAPPTKISLVGDTSTDPRAREAVENVGAELARFQMAARQRAGDMQQFSAQATLTGGIQVYYTRNNSLEAIQIYVPLSNPEGEEKPTEEEKPKGQGVLAIDVLFPCIPTTYKYNFDRSGGGPGGRDGAVGNASYRHMVRAAVGATITGANGNVLDVVSCTTWGQTGRSTRKLSTVNLEAFDVSKRVVAAPRTLEPPNPPFETDVQQPSQDSMYSWWVPLLPASAEGLYTDYYGATFLVRADGPSEKVSIDLWVACTDNMHITATFGEGNYFMPLYSLNVQCREFSSADQLVVVEVPLVDQSFEISWDQHSDWRNDPNYTPSTGPSYDVSWHFVAKDGWKDTPGADPCDRNAKNMGDLLWASQDTGRTFEVTSQVLNSGAAPQLGGKQLPDTHYTIPGWKVPWPPYVALVDDPEDTTNWGSPAAAMYKFATVQWSSRGSPSAKGSATVNFYDTGNEPPSNNLIPAGLCGGVVQGALN